MNLGMMGGMVIFWILIIVLAVLLVKELFNSNRNPPKDKARTVKQILEERFARGEITREQYKLMVKDIQ